MVVLFLLLLEFKLLLGLALLLLLLLALDLVVVVGDRVDVERLGLESLLSVHLVSLSFTLVHLLALEGAGSDRAAGEATRLLVAIWSPLVERAMDIVNVRLLTSIVARSWHTEARDSATRLRQVLRLSLIHI